MVHCDGANGIMKFLKIGLPRVANINSENLLISVTSATVDKSSFQANVLTRALIPNPKKIYP